jgi:hypothetical protein
MIIPAHSHAFKILHLIANSTNPLLGIALVAALVLLWQRNKSYAAGIFLATILSIILINIIRVGEAHYDIWSRWGMNFSTHAAITIAFCIPLALIWQKRWWLFLAIFIAYDILMMMMLFHSLADIVTTSALIIPICGVCQFVAWRKRKISSNAQAIES